MEGKWHRQLEAKHDQMAADKQTTATGLIDETTIISGDVKFLINLSSARINIFLRNVHDYDSC